MEEIGQIAVEPIMIVAIVGPIGLVLALLIGMVIIQRRKINQLEEAVRPKYGFLGKPLYALMAFAILAGSFGFTLVANQAGTDVPDVSAGRQLKAVVRTETIEQQGVEYLVSFSVIPVVNDTEWGTINEQYDAFWDVSGPEDFSEVELAISEPEPSSFTKLLAPGNYDITVDLFGPQDSAQTRISIRVP